MSLAPAAWVVVILVLLLAAAWLGLRGLGRWLAASDSLAPAAGIAVMGGRLPFRAMEAAAIYHQGWAPEIWLTRYPVDPENAALAQLGIEPTPEHHWSRQVLEKLGVPAAAIVTLEEPCVDTDEELAVLYQHLHMHHSGAAMIVVTSKSRGRRIKVIWHGRANRLIVRNPPQDSFLPERWFLNTRDLSEVAHEFFGVLNVLAGHPLRKRL